MNKNDITGDSLTTGAATDSYRDNYDRIFRSKAAKAANKDEESKPVPEDAAYARAEAELVQILEPLIGKTVSVETREEAVALIAAYASEKMRPSRPSVN
jgi:hypothetical protein